MMFYYTAFDLLIESEIQFPELSEASNSYSTDLKVIVKEQPFFSSSQLTIVAKNLKMNASDFCLEIEGVGEIYAKNGNQIFIYTTTKIDRKFRFYILTNALAAVLYQRKLIPLHASGVLFQGKVGLFVGESGAGKSTLAKAFEEKGYQIFTDDTCIIKKLDNFVCVKASYPVLKLWSKSFEQFDFIGRNEDARIWDELDKFAIYYHSKFIKTWSRLEKIFVLQISENQSGVTIERMTPSNSFMNIGTNVYRKELIAPMGLNREHFQTVSFIVNSCPAYKIVRPAYYNSLHEIVNLIEEKMIE